MRSIVVVFVVGLGGCADITQNVYDPVYYVNMTEQQRVEHNRQHFRPRVAPPEPLPLPQARMYPQPQPLPPPFLPPSSVRPRQVPVPVPAPQPRPSYPQLVQPQAWTRPQPLLVRPPVLPVRVVPRPPPFVQRK